MKTKTFTGILIVIVITSMPETFEKLNPKVGVFENSNAGGKKHTQKLFFLFLLIILENDAKILCY
jgi:hypothetical protein